MSNCHFTSACPGFANKSYSSVGEVITMNVSLGSEIERADNEMSTVICRNQNPMLSILTNDSGDIQLN